MWNQGRWFGLATIRKGMFRIIVEIVNFKV
jgi:hypothetical protein